MVLDTSVLVAILLDEAEAAAFVDAITADPIRLVSAGTLIEAAVVIESRFGEAGGRELDLLIHRAGILVSSVDERQAGIARTAYLKYGKGRHPAGLNFGDLFAYALARSTGEPLLFKGKDFTGTDVTPASILVP